MSDIEISRVLSQMRAMAAQAGGVDPAQEGPQAGQVDFSSLLKNSIERVNETQMEAGRMTEAFQAGDPNTDLTEVMIALQKAKVSFQAMTQVRNKLVDAYQEIMRMSI